jgi:hypothetical protein
MRQTSYTATDGRIYIVMLPDALPDAEAYRGMKVGPPRLDLPDLPEAVAVRLHNELAARRVLTYQDARRRPNEIAAALIAAMRLDAMAIVAQYDAPAIDALPPPE